jgi:ABC-type uncharacterized transport system substrate-binding protein
MKRLLPSLILACLTLFTVFHYSTLANAKDLKIAMMLWRGETEAEKGFRDGLKAFGYSVQYTVMNAGQDRTELGRLLREELKLKLDGFDYVYLFGTTLALAAKTIVTEKTRRSTTPLPIRLARGLSIASNQAVEISPA